MNTLRIKKGYTLNLEGKPAENLTTAPAPETVALIPEHIPYVKPRLLVTEGDSVETGSILLEDKILKDVKFASPGCGRVVQIQFGARRVLKAIVIELSENESAVDREAISVEKLQAIPTDKLTARLLESGGWPFLRALPFGSVADPKTPPGRIIVSLSEADPFQARPAVYLKGREALFDYGIKLLERLCPGGVLMTVHRSHPCGHEILEGKTTHVIEGAYPAGDPGVTLYGLRSKPESRPTWYVQGQDLLILAALLKEGRYFTERIVAVGGPGAASPAHVRTRMGAPVALVAPAKDAIFMAGGALKGHPVPADGYLGFHDTALTLLREAGLPEFLGFARPGYRKPSYSRTFLSALNRTDLPMDGGRHGEERACANCGSCAKVCPVEILPQFTYKAIVAEAVEEYLAHGLLDCVDCGLCSYVCPSKIELARAFKNAKAAYHKELNA